MEAAERDQLGPGTRDGARALQARLHRARSQMEDPWVLEVAAGPGLHLLDRVVRASRPAADTADTNLGSAPVRAGSVGMARSRELR